MGRSVRAHTPIIVYNEKTVRIVEAKTFFQAFDIYVLHFGPNLDDLSILSWENGRWVICAPEGIMEIANESTWTNSTWSKTDLHKKKVEFQIPVEGGIATGVGEFWVRTNSAGLLGIDIVTHTIGRDWAECLQTKFQLPDAVARKIICHPDPKVADFLLR